MRINDYSFLKRKWFYLFLFSLLFLSQTFPAWAKSEAERAYQKAERELKRFACSKQIKYRRYWLRMIYRFERIYLRFPQSRVAPKALYKTARLWEELYGYSGRKKDLFEALKHYRLLWEKYSRSPLADEALKRAISIYEKKLKDPVAALKLKRRLRRPKIRKSQAKPKNKNLASKTSHQKKKSFHPSSVKTSNPCLIKGVRHWSSQEYSRVVIDLSGRPTYKAHILKAHAGKPPRLYVDCTPAKLSPYLTPLIPIKDGLLKQVRLGQYRPKTVRVVLDLNSLTNYRVFFLDEPPRLVIDLVGQSEKPKIVCPKLPSKGPFSLAQQLGLCVRRIVIDPGHGGRDPGAKSRYGLREKDVVLKVSKLLAKKLRERLGCEVILTRSKDVFIPLEQRTAIANMKHTDLFISIHVNSSPNRRARGVETYYLNFATDKEAMRVAAMENAASTRSLGELQDLLKNILLHSKVEESGRLARDIQEELVRTLKRRYRRVKNRGVKTAPFVVLIGTRMPAVLVEIGFISNRFEERRLRDPRYLESVAEGLAKGIERYMKEIKLTAYR